MPFFYICLIALVQGITEFLPISSSGHLVLVHSFLGAEIAIDHAYFKLFDIALHVGTLLAVCVYFWRDIVAMLKGLVDALKRQNTANSRLLGYVLIGSVPAVLAGLIIFVTDAAIFDHVIVIGWTTLIFGLLLGLADKKFPQEHALKEMTWKSALLIGLAQAVALIPGTSRSGITMTAARFLKFDRVSAARYSLLLSMVAISGAGLLGSLSILKDGQFIFGQALLLGVALSFVTALLAITVMMRWLKSFSFMPFVIYRVILGIGLLSLAYSGLV